MSKVDFREIRWFFSGPAGDRAQSWFDALDGAAQAAYPRQDIYLFVSGRDDLGLKVREGRMEIKLREVAGTEISLLDGAIVGILEDWTKHSWNYINTIGEINAPFEGGPRVRVIKSRAQKKYDLSGGELVPVSMEDRPDCAFIVELTELYSQLLEDEGGPKHAPRRHWTIGCEAIAPQKQVARTLDLGARRLLKGYDGPALRRDGSYGYPRFALNVAEQATK